MTTATTIALALTVASMIQTVILPTKSDLNVAKVFIQRAKGSLILYLFQWLSVFAFVFLVCFLSILLLEALLPPVP